MQTLESRVASTEQSTLSNEKRGDLSQTMIQDMLDKLEQRVLNID